MDKITMTDITKEELIAVLFETQKEKILLRNELESMAAQRDIFYKALIDLRNKYEPEEQKEDTDKCEREDTNE